MSDIMAKPVAEVGDPALAAVYQFIDPLKDNPHITREDRVDLDQHPKHNGTPTFMAMPDLWPEIPSFPYYMGGHPQHAVFHEWIQSYGIWSLLYSVDTYNALTELSTRKDGDVIMTGIALELFPGEVNEFLGRAHGRPGTYTAGCRGPMCRAANTIAQRKRYLGKQPGHDRERMEDCLMRVRDSYEAYIRYVKHIMAHRRYSERNVDVTYRFWSQLNLAASILLDATDESENL